MTDIFLVRHAQSANNAQPEHLRVPDPALTELGVRQARLTADWFASVPVDRLFCSPFLRALETTRAIAERKHLAATVRADIFEQGGCYSGFRPDTRRGELGMSRSAIQQAYHGWQIDPRIGEQGWWGQDYESHHAAQRRAKVVARFLRDEMAPQGGSCVFVIHADFKRLLIDFLLEEHGIETPLELENPFRNVGVTLFRFGPSGCELLQLNSTDHLPGALISH